ncbi:MAG TPA: TonB-dependent receptor [Opitutaceae bacterium]
MSEPNQQLLTTNRKALTINLDALRYGTFAEIGAGQEVARHFFQAGGAAGTIAKTISAYDMTFSDEIYGKAPRYVSRERLDEMLRYEYQLLLQRLGDSRGATTGFFVFADTVSARNFKGTNECHGWMGVRLQRTPHEEPSDIIIHVRMQDKENVMQQQALGIVGVNLCYGAFYLHENPDRLVESLSDNIELDRIEVDMAMVRGPAFKAADNRLLSLHLVQCGLTNAVMFSPDGAVLQPSEALYKKAILAERGSFRPVTKVNVDMLQCACAQFVQEPQVEGKEVVVLAEITMHNLLAGGDFDITDFLARVDLLSDMGFNVLISNYPEYYRLVAYLRRFTREMIGLTMGIDNLLRVFDEHYYENLPGGILEAFGRMFRDQVRLYIYPMRQDALAELMPNRATPAGIGSAEVATAGDLLITAQNVQVAPHLRSLYAYLVENHCIDCLTGFNPEILTIYSREALNRIKEGDPSWEALVPANVVEIIKRRGLFGHPR